MEIERKFTVKQLPDNLSEYRCLRLSQAYISKNPVIRVRKQDESFILTVKGKGMMSREELNLDIDSEAYERLLNKAEGNIITKNRYLIPYDKYTIELDIFDEPFSGLIIAEVEFENETEANMFNPPEWFDKDVTFDRNYHNSNLAAKKF